MFPGYSFLYSSQKPFYLDDKMSPFYRWTNQGRVRMNTLLVAAPLGSGGTEVLKPGFWSRGPLTIRPHCLFMWISCWNQKNNHLYKFDFVIQIIWQNMVFTLEYILQTYCGFSLYIAQHICKILNVYDVFCFVCNIISFKFQIWCWKCLLEIQIQISLLNKDRTRLLY